MGALLGRRRALFGSLTADLFDKLALGILDQLSIYCQQTPFAYLRHGPAKLRHGAIRSYVFVDVTDRRGPLRMREAFAPWRLDVPTDDLGMFVRAINGRRWAFLDRWLHPFVTPLLSSVADTLVAYYTRRPYAVLEAGIIRFCEDVDRTWLVAEIDCRVEEEFGHDPRRRYLVQ